MKSNLGYTQKDVNLVISLGNTGGYLGIIVFGFLFDSFGPFLSSISSGVFLFSGYFLMHWANRKMIPFSSPMAGLYMGMVGFGSNGGYYTGLFTNVRNTRPIHRGKATGVLVAFYGLSAAIITQLYTLFEHNVARFFLFLSIILGFLPISTSLCVRLVPLEDKKEEGEKQRLLDENESQKEPVSNRPEALIGDVRLWGMIKTPEYLLLVLLGFFGTAIGVLFINIVSSVARSWEITSIQASTFVTVLSFCNAGGRVIVGFLMDLLRPYLREVAFFVICNLFMVVPFIAMIFVNSAALLMVGAVCAGLSFGGLFALTPFIVNRYFGDKNYGTNFALCTLAVSMGGLVFSYVSGALYDMNAIVDPRTGEKTCTGKLCYQSTFIMAVCSIAISIVAGLLLWWREGRNERRKEAYVAINE